MGSHEVGLGCKVHSFKTMENYLDTWHALGRFAKAEGLRDIEKITPDHIGNFLEAKIADGLTLGTIQGYFSAMEKFGAALNLRADKLGIDKRYSFSDRILECRGLARDCLTSDHQDRAYLNPGLIISCLAPVHQIAAAVQYEGGARIREAALVKPDQLLGDGRILLDNTKGGLDRVITVSMETYGKLEAYIAEHGGFIIDKDSYRDDLRQVSDKTGEDYARNGTHGLRYNFAQESYVRHISSGCSREEALVNVAEEMGHHRADITLHYIR